MKPAFYILLVVVMIFAFSFKVPQSTEEEGMGKYERINKIEKEVIALAKELKKVKQELNALKRKVKSL